MSKAFANPRIFAAASLLFVGATLFNLSANASPASIESGKKLVVSPSYVAPEPKLNVGPTFPPSPWDDEPSVDGSAARGM